MTEAQQYTVKVLLDDITFMLFDLERGGFIEIDGSFDVTDAFKVNYKRVLLSEIVNNDVLEIVSDFHIEVRYYDRDAIKYVTRGELRKFTVFEFDGFVCGMFLNALDTFRKEKFSINN